MNFHKEYIIYKYESMIHPCSVQLFMDSFVFKKSHRMWTKRRDMYDIDTVEIWLLSFGSESL